MLYVVATPIGNLEDMSYRAVRILSEVDLIAAEDTRHSRRLLDHYGIKSRMISCHEHNEQQRSDELVVKLKAGENPPNFARHYYDISCLLKNSDVQEFINSKNYSPHKNKRFRSGDETDLTKNPAFNINDEVIFEKINIMYENLAILVAFIFLYSVINGGLERTPISGAIVYTSFELIFGPLCLGLLTLKVDTEFLRTLAELTLALVLFTDAANANLGVLKKSFHIPQRLLLIGLPLTILLGFGVGVLVFKGLTLLEVAILAPIEGVNGVAQALTRLPQVPGGIVGRLVVIGDVVPHPVLNEDVCRHVTRMRHRGSDVREPVRCLER